MRIAFVVDPLAQLKPEKDSSIALMRSAAKRGHEVYAIESTSIHWRDNRQRVKASTKPKTVFGEALRLKLDLSELDNWHEVTQRERLALNAFDTVLMRKDPPFNFDYVSLTWLLSRAEAEGARVYNSPQALREHSEKVAVSEFTTFSVPTIISRDAGMIDDFIHQEQEVIVKPLDGMGGEEVYRLTPVDPNRNMILESITRNGARLVMAQRYVPQIKEGDKRVFLIDGAVAPWCLARLPKEGETRANLMAGGIGVARELSARDQAIAEALAPTLAARGLFLVGIDIIGDYLTEINVTSPTCMVEIEQQSGFSVADKTIEALEAHFR